MDEFQKDLLEQLGTQFSLALEGMLGEPWPASFHDAPTPEDIGRNLCWSQILNLSKEPMILVSAESAAWREIGTRALVAVGLEDPEESDVKATYLELLTQALSGLAGYLTQKAGIEVALESGLEAPLPEPGGGLQLQCLRLTSPTGFTADLFVRVEPALKDAIRQRQVELGKAPASAYGEQNESQPESRRAAGAAGTPSQAMDILLDVEMPVSISFGRTHLALKDVIKLSTGSIGQSRSRLR